MASSDREDRMYDALFHIRAWTRAYPVEMFPELTQPELAAIRAKLGDADMGRLHASWARHILAGINRYARAGLDEPPADEARPSRTPTPPTAVQ